MVVNCPPEAEVSESASDNDAWKTQQVKRAKALLKDGAIDNAKDLLQAVIAVDPKHFDALFDLGFLCDVSHDNEGFVKYITEALEVNPKHAHAWLYRGMGAKGEHDVARDAFTQAKLLDPTGSIGKDAQHQLVMLDRNSSCPLLPGDCWREATPQILSQKPRAEPVSVDEASLFPPRPPFRGNFCIHVWDDVLGPDLLTSVLDSIEDISMYLFRNPRQSRTFWLPRGAKPRVAAEVAGRILAQKLLGFKSDDFVGIEWWCKNQEASLGAHFHYDNAIADQGLFRPTYSSVLYLADNGGPTVVLDQAADKHHEQWPEIPQEGYAVMTRTNRWMVFPGELRHGMVTVDKDPRPRYVLLFNFWSYHKPGKPNCQEPDLKDYAPICATSPTARHLLSDSRLVELALSEDGRRTGHSGGPIAVHVETVCTPGDLDWHSNFGELPVTMPMPSLETLRGGSKGPAAFYLPWRRLARRYSEQGSHGTVDECEEVPPLSHRLPLFEHGLTTEMERRRTDAVLAWRESSFLITAREQALGAVVGAAVQHQLECRLGLSSLCRHVEKDLNHRLSAQERDGAFFVRNPKALVASTCDLDTLLQALCDAITEAMPDKGIRCESIKRLSDREHGFVMLCERITLTGKVTY